MMAVINLHFPIRIAAFLATGRCVNRNKSAALSPPLVSYKIVKILSNAGAICTKDDGVPLNFASMMSGMKSIGPGL